MRQDIMFFSSTGIFVQSFTPESGFPTRNSLLFSLAVVLLEIYIEVEMPNLHPAKTYQDAGSAFVEAQKRAHRLAPTKFGLAIRKLVDCDFGSGDDLNMPLMQTEFAEDVIRPLEEMEQYWTGRREYTNLS